MNNTFFKLKIFVYSHRIIAILCIGILKKFVYSCAKLDNYFWFNIVFNIKVWRKYCRY